MVAGYDTERVVVTGIGVVSPVGIGKDEFWKNLVAGHSGIDFLRAFPNENLPSKLAAEIHDFDPREFVREKKFLKVMSRSIQLGVSAASLAMGDAGLSRGDVTPERLGVEFGCGRISTTPQEFVEAVENCSNAANDFQITRWGEDGMGQITPLLLLRQLPNMPACHVSIEFDAQGPNNTITSRDASALLALSEASHAIRRGTADCMIVGACSSNIDPVDITRLNISEGLSQRHDDPLRACRPFDFTRDGTVIGEGSGAFVIESYKHAVARGADIYAEVLSVGAGCDGRGYSNGASGTGLVRAIEQAISRAEIEPGDLGHINANGKSTQRDDLIEARALHRALGSAAETLPVTALKSYFGNSDAGTGALELAGSLLALREGVLPHTLNYETPDPRCRLNVVHDGPYRLSTRAAMSVNRTAMGQSAAAVIRAV
jgi:3-oxoacyl-[acyl-carrier-protein] synthase II